MDSQEMFSFDIRSDSGFVILTPLSKELTFKNSKTFLTKAKSLLEDHGRAIAVLNLSNVEIIDSMSLGTLVALLKHVKKIGGDLIVTNLADPIKVLFNLLNFKTVFQCFETVEDAIAGFDPNA